METNGAAAVAQASDIVEGLQQYWDKRSSAYSRSNIEELNSFKGKAYAKLLLENAPKKEKLRVLDVGAGPGLFSILMAEAGHEVTAVDVTQAMLDQAQKNAQELGLSIQCVLIDGCELPFEDDSFDLIISRNVVWNLDSPQKAMCEWKRLLSPGGRTVYFDANHYLHLFDEEQNKRIQRDRKELENRFGEKYEETIQTKQMERIAKELVCSRVKRPSWDEKTLPDCGFRVLKIEEDMGRYVWDDYQKIKYKGLPMFMVVAQA